MLVNFYRFFTLVNEQKKAQFCHKITHTDKIKNDARVSHEEGAHANMSL